MKSIGEKQALALGAMMGANLGSWVVKRAPNRRELTVYACS